MTLTTITGYIYNALGQEITTGRLYLTLRQDMVAATGEKVAPFQASVNLEDMTPDGNISISVVPTAGASPTGVTYLMEFDPDPSDVTKPMNTKDGYFYNYISVPASSPVPIGQFTAALRGTPAASYMPVGAAVNSLSGTHAGSAGSSAGYLTLLINGVQKKFQYFDV